MAEPAVKKLMLKTEPTMKKTPVTRNNNKINWLVFKSVG